MKHLSNFGQNVVYIASGHYDKCRFLFTQVHLQSVLVLRADWRGHACKVLSQTHKTVYGFMLLTMCRIRSHSGPVFALHIYGPTRD